ncbi:MAG: allophanate hydrolase subunit 1 [Rhizobiaceae bacterium]
MITPSFKAVADHALLVEFGTMVDDDVNRTAIALDKSLATASIEGVNEVIPGMVNLLVIFDPLKTGHMKVQSAVEQLLPVDQQASDSGREHLVNVCYEDPFGPDLEAVAKACGMSTDAVINAHSASRYRVSMYGFAPGFAYLSGVPDAIQVPRKNSAVRDIAAGSVLIAGPQCLTTTLIMPTGWSIIGRTDVQVITGKPERPFLYDVGDTVRFRRVAVDELKGDVG